MAIDKYVLEGVSKALYGAFGKPIYVEYKENMMEFPCFYVQWVDSSEELHIHTLYEHVVNLDICYFVNDKDLPTDMRDEVLMMGERMYEVLEYISLGEDKLRGTKMKYRITDGVLHFLVSYEGIFRRGTKKIPTMEHLDIIEGGKQNGASKNGDR